MRTTGLHLATSADAGADASRVVGYGAFALEYAASARLADADREHLLSACMTSLQAATQRAANRPRRPSPVCRPRFRRGARPSSRSPKTSGFAAASVRLSRVGRSSTMRSPTQRRRRFPTRASRRSRSPNSLGFASTSRYSLTRVRFPPETSSKSRTRSSPTVTGSFSPRASGVRCFCQASGATFPRLAHSSVISFRRGASRRIAGPKGLRRGAFESSRSARHGGKLIRRNSRRPRSTRRRSIIEAGCKSLQRSAPKVAPSSPPKTAGSKKSVRTDRRVSEKSLPSIMPQCQAT